MTVKSKIETAKKKAVKYLPLATAASGLAAVVYAIVVVRSCENNSVTFTAEDREMLKEEGTDIRYNFKNGDVFSMRYVDNIPKN